MTRDVSLAEDLAQDALVAALEQWPATGVPDNPVAWLMTTAKRRAIDHFRRADSLRRKVAELEHARGREDEAMPDVESQVDYIEDDVLRLIFLSCHPILTPESRAALTLRLVGGLTTAEIARGFLATESTMGQRISRAKKTLSEAHAEFELPAGPERTKRLDDVMAVIYLIFNEGYTATAGEEWMRPDLANEAIRLARMLAALAPDEPEVLGLQALLEIQGSRMPARLDEDGAPVLLEAQDRSLWDQLLIRRGMAALEKARAAGCPRDPGREVLPAGLDRCAARPRSTRRGHGLVPDRGVVRRPGPRRARPGRRGEPGGRARSGVRPCRRARRARGGGRRFTRRLTAGSERARGPARAGRAARAGAARRSPRQPRVPRTRANVPSSSAEPTGTGRLGRTRMSRPSRGELDQVRPVKYAGLLLPPKRTGSTPAETRRHVATPAPTSR